MTKLLSLVIVLLSVNFGLFVNQNNPNPEWNLSKSKDQISIYTRRVSYSNYKEFKGEVIVFAKPEDVINLLMNIDEFKHWLPDCLESKKLKQISNAQQINYILTEVPWSYEDRDIVYKFTIVGESLNSGEFRIFLENKPQYISGEKDVVRIPKSKGSWIITPLSDHKTKLVYQMHVEPGGYVPSWLANLKITDTPYAFLYNLREQLKNN